MKKLAKKLKAEASAICNRCKTEVRSMTEEEIARIEEIKQLLDALTKVEDEDVTDEEVTDDAEDARNTDEDVAEDEKEEDVEEKSDDKPEDEEDVEEKEDCDEEEEDKEQRSFKSHKNIRNKNLNIKTKKMEKRFSLINAINAVAKNGNLNAGDQAVINAGREEMRKAGLSFNGQIQLPVNSRAFTVTGEGGVHDDLVETQFEDILAPLYAKNVLIQAGAKYITGCVGDVQVPVMSAGNVGWETEVGDAKNGKGEVSSVKLTPKRLTAYVDLSKQFLAQDSLSAEALIRQDLVNAINAKLEATILGDAEGTATQPGGIFAGNTLEQITTYKGICDFEAGVEEANVYGECKYIMSPKAKAAFRNMAKSTKSTELVFADGTLDGTPVLSTSNVAATNVAYGDFSNLAIAQWSGLDITVDPYTKAAQGMVRIVVNAYFDAKVLRPEAIAVAKA